MSFAHVRLCLAFCTIVFLLYPGPTPNGDLVGKSVDDSDDVDAIRPAPLEEEEEEEEFQQHQPSSDQEQRQRRKKVGEIQDAYLIRCGTMNCSRQVALEAEHMVLHESYTFLPAAKPTGHRTVRVVVVVGGGLL